MLIKVSVLIDKDVLWTKAISEAVNWLFQSLPGKDVLWTDVVWQELPD